MSDDRPGNFTLLRLHPRWTACPQSEPGMPNHAFLPHTERRELALSKVPGSAQAHTSLDTASTRTSSLPRRLRIAMILDTCEPYYHGGYEARAWHIAKNLAERADVTIFTSAPSHARIEGVTICPVTPVAPYVRDDGYRNLRQAMLFSLRLLRHFPQQRQFDIVDCNSIPFLHIYSAALLARQWNAKLVVTAHEALSHTFRPYLEARQFPLPRISAAAIRGIYYHSQRLADSLVVCSAVAGAQLQREGFNSVTVVPGGVQSIDRPRSNHARRIAFVGRLVPNKRVHTLLAAFRLAQLRGSAEHLLIIGDGPLRASLERAAVSLGCRTAVQFAGAVSDQRKLELLRDEADVFVSASVREGISLATLEALALGMPVVISSDDTVVENGATEYVTEANGRVVDGSARAIADAIEQICASQEQYRLMSCAAVATGAKFTWRVAADRLHHHYQTLLGP